MVVKRSRAHSHSTYEYTLYSMHSIFPFPCNITQKNRKHLRSILRVFKLCLSKWSIFLITPYVTHILLCNIYNIYYTYMIRIKFRTLSLTTNNRLVVLGRAKIRTLHLPDAVNCNHYMFLSPVCWIDDRHIWHIYLQ